MTSAGVELEMDINIRAWRQTWLLSKSKVISTQKVCKNYKSVPYKNREDIPNTDYFIQKNEWCRGSDDAKENTGEQSEYGLFSKSNPSSDRTRFI